MIVVAVLLVAVGGAYFGAKSDKASPTTVGSNDATGAPGGSTSTTLQGLPPDDAEYLSTGGTFVDFIQWNDNGGTLSGTAQEVSTQGAVPELETVTDSFGLSGSLNGTVVSMSYDHGIQVFGTVVSGAFTVLFPQPGGTMGLVTFQATTPAQYSAAVATLSQDVDQENQSATGAQALQQATQTVNGQAAKVQSDISGLSQDESATTSAQQPIAGTLEGQANEVTTTQRAEQQVAVESGSSNQSNTCGEAAVLAGDASIVAGDAQDVAGEAAAVEATLSAVSGMRAAISELNSDYSQLQKDESAVPGYLPANAPSQSAVSKALSDASTAVQAAVSATNWDIDQANAGVSTAYQYVAQGYQAARTCGSAPSAPQPQQHIS